MSADKIMNTIQKSMKDISTPMRKINFAMNLQLLMKSPQMLGGAILVLSVVAFLIWIAIEFFSRNRFRGISWGIFTKLISLNSYIKKFNDQLFEDFSKIHDYVESRNALSSKLGDSIRNDAFFQHSILLKIHKFVKHVKSKANESESRTPKTVFNQYINAFFSPNPSFPTDEAQRIDLKNIFKSLYSDEFHNKFSNWLNYESIWNFTYPDQSDVLKILLNTSFITNQELKKIIDNSVYKKYPENDDMVKISKIMKDEITLTIMNKQLNNVVDSYDLKQQAEIKKNLQNLFFSDISDENSIQYSSISQHFKENCSLLTDRKQSELIKKLNDIGLSDELLKMINQALSFVDVLDQLFKDKYTVSKNLLNVPNLHDHIKKQLQIALKTKSPKEGTMIVFNACFQVYNELAYSKIENEDETVKFIFIENDERNNLDKNMMCKHLNLLFNVHTSNMFRSNIDQSKKFISSFETLKKFRTAASLASSTHVSIARLKYLIQDYFIIINDYNDKSHPDKEDIRDFWERRVNRFGFPISGTKASNRPRHAPDIDYVTSKANRTTDDDPFTKDHNLILKKNTIWELYKEFASSIFLKTRHPKIPFFQSIMATIRYLIPDPDVVIDDFLAQLKGQPKRKVANPINYDFSFQYNPYIKVVR